MEYGTISNVFHGIQKIFSIMVHRVPNLRLNFVLYRLNSNQTWLIIMFKAS